MSIEEKLKNFIVFKYGSLSKFAPYTGLPYSTIQSILRRGVNNCSGQNLQAICNALDISMVALMEGKIEEAPTILVEAAPPPTPVEIEAFFLRYIFMNSSQLMLDGIKLSDEEKKYLSNYLEIMIDIMRNKRKSNKKLSEGDMPW